MDILRFGKTAKAHATAQDKATLQEAVRKNEAAVARGGGPTLSADAIDHMSVDDLDRYFSADRAVDTVERLGENARLNHNAKQKGLLALACAGGTVAFPPLMIGIFLFGGLALIDKVKANQSALEGTTQDLKQEAAKESQALLERAQTADPAAAAEERQAFISRLPAGVSLEQAYTQEGDWLTAP